MSHRIRWCKLASLAALMCAAPAIVHAGTVYKIVDGAGTVTYSDRPASNSAQPSNLRAARGVPVTKSTKPATVARSAPSVSSASNTARAAAAVARSGGSITVVKTTPSSAAGATKVAAASTSSSRARAAAAPIPVAAKVAAAPVPAPTPPAPTPPAASPTPTPPTSTPPAANPTPTPPASTPPAAGTTPGPSAPTAAVCSGVQIAPGTSADQIQHLVDAQPAGTVFCFASGTYVLNHYITLKEANQFICPARRTCVLTGLDQYRGALAAQYGSAHQLIRGFVVEHFIAVPGQWPLAGLQLRDYGVIEDNETRFNQTGLDIGSNQTLRGNFVHHNRQYGISGGPANNILIDSNEVAWNNTDRYDPNDDAGGSKIIGGQNGTSQLTWRRNHVHDNYGQGIWSDGNVRNALYEENLIENNGGVGIDHEISWDAVMRNNVLRNNNTFEQGQGKSCWHGSQLQVNNSQNVAIYGNTIESIGINAICVSNTRRQERAVFPQALANISVRGNVIKMRGPVNIGMVGDTVPENVTFSGNIYYLDNLSASNWAYGNTMTLTQWRASGHDVDGQFLTW